MNPTVLLTFTGNHDPFGDAEGNPGPVLSLLNQKAFDRVFLFWTRPEYL